MKVRLRKRKKVYIVLEKKPRVYSTFLANVKKKNFDKHNYGFIINVYIYGHTHRKSNKLCTHHY